MQKSSIKLQTFSRLNIEISYVFYVICIKEIKQKSLYVCHSGKKKHKPFEHKVDKAKYKLLNDVSLRN